jgi:hypothetical protein
MPVELTDAILGAIFAAQVGQIGFSAALLRQVTRAETKIEERTDPGDGTD